MHLKREAEKDRGKVEGREGKEGQWVQAGGKTSLQGTLWRREDWRQEGAGGVGGMRGSEQALSKI